MEGFLLLGNKKSRSFKKVWTIIDGNQLMYYNDFDEDEGIPINYLGIIHLNNDNIKIEKMNNNIVSNGIYIKLEKGKAGYLFDCSNPNNCSTWYNVLIRTINYKQLQEEQRSEPYKYREILGFSADDVLTKGMISKQYKKLCLLKHPDKGGNIEEFNIINNAYNQLIELQLYEDEKNTTKEVQYEAIIQKGGPKAGLGLVVKEDKIRNRIIVTTIQSSIKILGITEESDGVIKEGDQLIGIDQDECAHWFFTRIRARLNDYRVSEGKTVLLTFVRRVPRSPSEVASPLPSPVKQTRNNSNNRNGNLSAFFQSVDEVDNNNNNNTSNNDKSINNNSYNNYINTANDKSNKNDNVGNEVTIETKPEHSNVANSSLLDNISNNNKDLSNESKQSHIPPLQRNSNNTSNNTINNDNNYGTNIEYTSNVNNSNDSVIQELQSQLQQSNSQIAAQSKLIELLSNENNNLKKEINDLYNEISSNSCREVSGCANSVRQLKQLLLQCESEIKEFYNDIHIKKNQVKDSTQNISNNTSNSNNNDEDWAKVYMEWERRAKRIELLLCNTLNVSSNNDTNSSSNNETNSSIDAFVERRVNDSSKVLQS